MSKDKPYTEKEEARFLSKIEIDHDSGCWQWQAYTNHAGYGQFRFRKTTVVPRAIVNRVQHT